MSTRLPRLADSSAVDRALIQFICVRKTHRRKPPVDFLELSGAGLRLMAVVVLTTLITLAVTALVFAALARLLHADDLAPGKPETEERS